MDQGSDNIRQDIESTRAALDEKLDTLETRARQAFDVKHQVSERPWMMLGTAVAAGFVLGRLGGDDSDQRWSGQPMIATDYNQHAGLSYRKQDTPSSMSSSISSGVDDFLSQFDDEIDMLKAAALSMLSGFLRDTIKEYVPALGRQLDQVARERGKTPSTAPNNSPYYEVRDTPNVTNYEGIPATTSYGSNLVDDNAEHATPYYPPGGARDATVKAGTYNSPSDRARERSVGEDTTRY